MRTHKAVVTVLTGAVVPVLLSGTAFAAPSDAVIQRENYYGLSEFQGDGEHLGCYDYAADGWGTRAEIQRKNSAGNWVDTSLNCFDDTSTTTDGSGWSWKNGSITDGTVVRIHLWSSHGSSTSSHVYSESVKA